MPASLSQPGSVGSFRYCAVITPTDLSKPAEFNAGFTSAPFESMMCIGCQSMSATLRIDMAENFGVLASTSTSAPDAFRSRICESMVGSVIS